MEWEDFSKKLQELGYFRYVPLTKRKNVPKMLDKIRKTRSLYGAFVYRDYPADEERLTECGVKEFLEEVMPILQANNITIHSINESCSRTGYTLHINNDDVLLYSGTEMESDTANLWSITTKRAFSMINKLFRQAGSDERIFSRGFGNDHWSFFLSRRLHDLINKSEIILESEELFLYEDIA
jgi:hypothetical protein